MLKILFLAAIAFAQTDSRIQNGEDIPLSSSLHISIARLTFPNGACTGIFISADTVLTAGHCTHDRKFMYVNLRHPKGYMVEQASKAVITHPDYLVKVTPQGNYSIRRDFGIVKLRKPMPIPVIPLAIRDPRMIQGEFPVNIVGYGRNERASGVLRKGVMLASVVAGKEFFGEPGLEMHPANSEQQATCPGDSGGPVLLQGRAGPVVIGVHSLSNACAGASAYISHSAIPANVIDWIRAQ